MHIQFWSQPLTTISNGAVNGSFGLISSTHTIPRHTVHGLDNILYNTLTTYFNMTYSLERQDTADK